MENELVRVKINRRGEVVSFVDKESAASTPRADEPLLMYKDVPRLFDAWDIDSHYELQEVPWTSRSRSAWRSPAACAPSSA